jgi:hypothetical protein
LHNPPANGKQSPIPEEMSQTLLSADQENARETWTMYTSQTLLSQSKLALTARNTLLQYKIIGAPKKIF